jgi:hypothetical protein
MAAEAVKAAHSTKQRIAEQISFLIFVTPALIAGFMSEMFLKSKAEHYFYSGLYLVETPTATPICQI